MPKFSVLLKYPEGEPETYYTTVEAKNRDAAVEEARRECIEANYAGMEGEDREYDVDDLEEVLVLAGEHPAI